MRLEYYGVNLIGESRCKRVRDGEHAFCNVYYNGDYVGSINKRWDSNQWELWQSDTWKIAIWEEFPSKDEIKKALIKDKPTNFLIAAVRTIWTLIK